MNALARAILRRKHTPTPAEIDNLIVWALRLDADLKLLTRRAGTTERARIEFARQHPRVDRLPHVHDWQPSIWIGYEQCAGGCGPRKVRAA